MPPHAMPAVNISIDENSGGLGMPVFALMAAQQQGIAQAEQSKKLAEAIGRMFPGEVHPAGGLEARGPEAGDLARRPMVIGAARERIALPTDPLGEGKLSLGGRARRLKFRDQLRGYGLGWRAVGLVGAFAVQPDHRV